MKFICPFVVTHVVMHSLFLFLDSIALAGLLLGELWSYFMCVFVCKATASSLSILIPIFKLHSVNSVVYSTEQCK
jgi:hypothetical protein